MSNTTFLITLLVGVAIVNFIVLVLLMRMQNVVCRCTEYIAELDGVLAGAQEEIEALRVMVAPKPKRKSSAGKSRGRPKKSDETEPVPVIPSTSSGV